MKLNPSDLPYIEQCGLCARCGQELVSQDPDTLLCADCAKWVVRMSLAQRIAKHVPPVQMPLVDKTLLMQTARRLQRSADVLLAMPCSKVKN
jgi:hypothetical protein